MSFWEKVKKFFGIDGLKVRIQAPFKANVGDELDAVIKLIGNKKVEKISQIKVKLHYQKKVKSGDRIRTYRQVIDSFEINEEFEIGPGQEREFPIKLNVNIVDEEEKTGFMGAAQKLGKMMSNTDEELKIHVRAESNYSPAGGNHIIRTLIR